MIDFLNLIYKTPNEQIYFTQIPFYDPFAKKSDYILIY